VERIVFFVNAPLGQAGSPIAFLASSATFMAYANSHYLTDNADMEMKGGFFLVLNEAAQFFDERRDLGLSTYDTHLDGSGVCYSSRLRPMQSMRLTDRIWTLRADTHVTDWMSARGFSHDLVTDEAIHYDGLAALAPYRVLVTGTHPEYWTTRMWDVLVEWQARGGRIIYLGGNGFYWRTAFHPERNSVVEVRRAESGARYWATEPGEDYLSFSGEHGGLWRRLGRPPQGLVGVGTIATGFDKASYYRRTEASRDPRAAFIFEGVPEDIVGDFGALGGGAAGQEIDSADPRLGTPPHALVLARSERHSRYFNIVPEETPFHHPTINGEESEHCHADLVFYEGPGGGAVFSTGSINWAASLAHKGYDNNVARITENVLRRFADPAPFAVPSRR
jgi:N,N-dimethylformamidase